MKKRTWRKFWIPVMMIIALINSSFPVSAHDVPNGGEESSSPYVVCKYCVMGYAVLVCDKTPIYDGSSTHKYNLTKTCTKKYYQANYKGYKCEACGRINPLFGVENGLNNSLNLPILTRLHIITNTVLHSPVGCIRYFLR